MIYVSVIWVVIRLQQSLLTSQYLNQMCWFRGRSKTCSAWGYQDPDCKM